MQFKSTMTNDPYKNQYTEQYKNHAEHQEATDIFLCFLDFSIFIFSSRFLKWFLYEIHQCEAH